MCILEENFSRGEFTDVRTGRVVDEVHVRTVALHEGVDDYMRAVP